MTRTPPTSTPLTESTPHYTPRFLYYYKRDLSAFHDWFNTFRHLPETARALHFVIHVRLWVPATTFLWDRALACNLEAYRYSIHLTHMPFIFPCTYTIFISILTSDIAPWSQPSHLYFIPIFNPLHIALDSFSLSIPGSTVQCESRLYRYISLFHGFQPCTLQVGHNPAPFRLLSTLARLLQRPLGCT